MGNAISCQFNLFYFISNLDTRVDKLQFFEFNFKIFVISSQKYLQLKFMKIEINQI
jgi:hypothetical protein